MENSGLHNELNGKWIALAWGLCCVLAAFFIPSYDLGFDAIKIWLYLCVVLLGLLLGGAWLNRMIQNRR